MKKNFYKIFIWISGSDTDLLKDCAESEHKKYALQGGLVLIPTIMAFVSMSYASYILLTQNVYFCSIITMVWAGIIFIIDRYIVATFIKKPKGKDWLSAQFLIRIIFAIGLGIVISHPVIIRVFDDKIQETQTEIGKTKRDTIEKEVFAERDTANYQLKNRVDTLTKELDIIRKVISAEMVGANDIIGGYYVSNLSGSGKRVAKLVNDTDSIGNEIRNLKVQITTNNTNAILKRDTLIREYENTVAKGYWGKDDALKEYLDESNEWIKYWFILLFFVFVDVTAVVLKVFTRYGEYDSKLELQQTNRIEQKKYFLGKMLEKKKHFEDKDCEWEINKINKIFEENKDNYHTEIKAEFNEVGTFYDEDEKNTEKEKGILKEIEELSKNRLFKKLSIVAIFIGIVIAFVIIILSDKQDSNISVYFPSLTVSFIANLSAGIALHTLHLPTNHKKTVKI